VIAARLFCSVDLSGLTANLFAGSGKTVLTILIADRTNLFACLTTLAVRARLWRQIQIERT
jgi:hypothetical protein